MQNIKDKSATYTKTQYNSSQSVSSDEELLIVSQELESDSETTAVDEPNKSVENDSGVELIEDYAAWAASYFLEQQNDYFIFSDNVIFRITFLFLFNIFSLYSMLNIILCI